MVYLINKDGEMKKTGWFFVVLLWATRAVWGADTLFVRERQIPMLIDRTDNVWYEMRVPARSGSVLNEITLHLDEQTDWKAIQAVRLFYSGVESRAREGEHFSATTYVSSHIPGNTRKALAAYSVVQDEKSPVASTVRLTSEQPMPEGINYFWISVQLRPEANLSTTFGATIEQALIDRRPVPVVWKGKVQKQRVGLGVRQAGDDGSAAFRIPGLVTTRKGTLLGVYDIRYNSSVDLQEKVDIGLSRSTDKGQTWEPMRVAMTFGEDGGLPQAQNGVGDPSILVDEKTNTVWVIAAWTHGMGNQRAWWSSFPGMDKERTAQLMLVKSEDDGKTWSKPINITPEVKDPSWYFLLQGPGRGITMQDGTLVFPIQFIDSTRIPHAGIMYSKDRGNSWHLHQPARSNTTESQVAEVEPGVLMLNMRDNRGGSRAVSVTTDLGKTWTEHPSNRSALPEPVCMASLLQVPAAENSLGKDVLLFSNPNTTKGRNHITVKASLDGGLTWPSEYQIVLDEGEGWGYSCLTMIDRETIGILYESSVAHMTFQTIRLTDLVR